MGVRELAYMVICVDDLTGGKQGMRMDRVRTGNVFRWDWGSYARPGDAGGRMERARMWRNVAACRSMPSGMPTSGRPGPWFS